MPIYRLSASVFHVRYPVVTPGIIHSVNALLSSYNPLSVVIYEFPDNHKLPAMPSLEMRHVIDGTPFTDNRIYINAGGDSQIAILLAHQMFRKFGQAWFVDNLADGLALVARLSVAGVG